MNSAPSEMPAWSRSRWWTLVALVFAAQLVLIFALGERQPVTPRAVNNAARVQMTVGRSELLAAQDPTLFALPQPHGFSALAWLNRAAVEPPVFRWTEAPRLLALAPAELGLTFRRFMQTNPYAPFALEAKPAPAFTRPGLPAPAGVTPAQSTLRFTGDLAQRALLTPVALPAWQHPDVLTNTVVQVIVDAEGNVFSALVLAPGSGHAGADAAALAFVKAARFTPQTSTRNPTSTPFSSLTQGHLVFEWCTEPPPATSGTPPP